jgi:hypothetical protein
VTWLIFTGETIYRMQQVQTKINIQYMSSIIWLSNIPFFRVLVGKPEGKRPLERPRRRWANGIRMDIREFGWGIVEWIQLAQDKDWLQALTNTVMNLRALAPRS